MRVCWGLHKDSHQICVCLFLFLEAPILQKLLSFSMDSPPPRTLGERSTFLKMKYIVCFSWKIVKIKKSNRENDPHKVPCGNTCFTKVEDFPGSCWMFWHYFALTFEDNACILRISTLCWFLFRHKKEICHKVLQQILESVMHCDWLFVSFSDCLSILFSFSFLTQRCGRGVWAIMYSEFLPLCPQHKQVDR